METLVDVLLSLTYEWWSSDEIWPFRGFFIVLMTLWWISPPDKILPFLMGVNWGQLQINGN